MIPITIISEKSALEFRNQGARIIGGCCGTTPQHISAMAEAVKDLAPITEKEVKVLKEEIISIQDQRTEPGLDELAVKKTIDYRRA
ncbi:hypothetical protein BsIDN1_20320 [Bacillus safensis]|uniref:Hcy-binding domain-containing protein n=1 Tax=Bacillus safensis TaxID=561879 RepID=A0A5S9M8D4_BACIA|nr:hypothetical protein BsIDN1_20320 [Bacillus safensis]